ncbi:hypothetical protein FOC27_09455 [Burkholderia multivorans]|uniref:right-handed parallel beta-helix repeat-containing protein n=1 Tax=Burkholderia multivorans TaxID=87883 RepID=UPI0012DF233F|nr:glycosyl hydrolase family 28-related protein [Burkholderia multivorans]QGR60432.1 hypothetical protein FOC27_09455 [Burkholderia multivorans]
MTVTSSTQDVSYSTDGATVDFPVPFYFIEDADVLVDKIDGNENVVALRLGTDFIVSGAGDQNGSQIKTLTTYPAGFTLHIYRIVPVTQETQYQQNDPFPAKSTEKALDKLTMIAQQNSAAVANAIRYPRSEFGVDGTLPSSSERALKVLGFDVLGRQTMLPLPASVGAGDLRNEMWRAGVDFEPGTSTSVTLSRAYGTKANIGIVVMAGVAQAPDTYSVSGNTLTFLDDTGSPAPIPEGVDKIWCIGGTTLSIWMPADESVGDPQLNWRGILGRTVDSIAALRQLDKSRYDRVIVVGYYAPGDGGGGIYVHDATDNSSDDNGGTIIKAADGGRWKLSQTSPVSVRQFGAKGDGAFNDTAAFKAALSAVDTLFVPAGRFVITGAIGSKTNSIGQKILGTSGGQSILQISGTNAQLQVSGYGWQVRNICFEAAGIPNAALVTGETSDNHGSVLDSCQFVCDATGTSYFTAAAVLNNVWSSTISNNDFRNAPLGSTTCRGYGLQGNYSVNNAVFGNKFQGFDKALYWSDVQGYSHYCEGWLISNNTFVVNNYHLYLAEGLQPTIANNIIDITQSGFAIYCRADTAHIRGNWINTTDLSSGAILFDTVSRPIVEGNTISKLSAGTVAIAGTATSYLIVRGNTILGFGLGLSANSGGAGCFGWTVDGNTFLNQSARAFDLTLLTAMAPNYFGSGNIISGTSPGTYASNVYIDAKQYNISVLLGLSGGSSQDVDIPIPAGIFLDTPDAGMALSASDEVIGFYVSSASTATSARFTLKKRDGTNLPSANVRFSVFLSNPG